MASKPTIAGPELELDAREIPGLGDQDPVATWPDQSGAGNDAIGENTPTFLDQGWTEEIPAVRLQNIAAPANNEAFQYDGSFIISSPGFTLFAVFEATDISAGLAIWGADSSSSPGNRFLELFVLADGSMVFNRSLDTYDIQTAPGVIVEGERYQVTVRFSITTGVILRVNEVEVGANPLSAGISLSYADSRLGEINEQTTGGVGQLWELISCSFGSVVTRPQHRILRLRRWKRSSLRPSFVYVLYGQSSLVSSSLTRRSLTSTVRSWSSTYETLRTHRPTRTAS